MKNTITIKDIARKLNLSTSTVSRALSDSWEIKAETKELILSTAAEMGYRPNPLARGLVTKKSYTIGIVVPELSTSFFPYIIAGIQRVLMNAGYKILITSSNESPDTERTNLETLERFMVDGIIISTTSESDANISVYNKLQANGIPMVFFNRVPEEVSVTKIIIDDEQLAYNAVSHLISCGHRRIFHLSGPEKMIIAQKRAQGFRRAMTEAGLELPKNSIIPSGIFISDGKRAMSEILDRHDQIPTAIFAFNDPVAIGAMKETMRRGLQVPDDIAFVGFSESDLATIIEPNLTSVEQPRTQIGEVAATSMIEQIRLNRNINKTIVLNAKLNIRDSSQKMTDRI